LLLGLDEVPELLPEEPPIEPLEPLGLDELLPEVPPVAPLELSPVLPEVPLLGVEPEDEEAAGAELDFLAL